MKIPEKVKAIGFVLVAGLFLASCTKTVKFEASSRKVRPLDTQARKIVLHEDYIFAEKEAEKLKQQLLKSIRNKMKNQSKFRFEFIPAGKAIPRNSTNKPLVFITGDIMTHKGQTSGKDVKKVTRYKRSKKVSQHWDELENQKWNKNQLQTFITLYFVEIGSETKLLRSTMTASSDNRQRVWTGNKVVSDTQKSAFFEDKKIKPAHTVIQSKETVLNPEKTFAGLALKAVNTHFDSL